MAARLSSLLLTTSYVRPDMRQIMGAGLGGAFAIGLLGLAMQLSGSALLMAPLGATAVLVFGLPLPGVAGAFLLYLIAVLLRRAEAPSNR